MGVDVSMSEKGKRVWPRVVLGIVLLAAGVFTMGTDVGNTQWIIGLIIVLAAVAVFVQTFMARRKGPAA